MKPMGDEFGWSRAQFSGVVLVAAIGGSILSLVLGPIMDRRGPKLVMLAGGALMGLLVSTLSQVKQLWQFYGLFGLGRSVMAGGTDLAISVAVTNWFRRRRGRVIAIALAGQYIGGAVLPFFVYWLIAGRGWRFAWFALGIVLTIIAVLPSLLVRNRPEDMGLSTDGDNLAVRGDSRPVSPLETKAKLADTAAWTRRMALAAPAFWLVAIANSLGSMGFGALNMHQFPCLTDAGIPATAAVSMVSITSVFALVSGLLWGLIAERAGGRWCAVVVLLGHAVSALLLMFAHTMMVAYIFAVVWGIASGGLLPVFMLVWAEYFGRPSQGLVRGMSIPLRLLGNTTGPIWVGFVFDKTGSYYPALVALVAVFVTGAVIMFLSRSPTLSAVAPRQGKLESLPQ